MRIKRSLAAFAAVLAFVVVTGCGSSGSGGGGVPGAPGGPVDPIVPPIDNSDIIITGGDGQSATIGEQLAQPLSIIVYGQSGAPAANYMVTFSVSSGMANLSSAIVSTNTDGEAQVYLTMGARLSQVKVSVTATGIGSVRFTADPILPTLKDVVDATIVSSGEAVSGLPVMLGTLEDGQEVLAILWGNEPGADLSVLPTVGDLLGGDIQGAAIEDYPIVFIPGESLFDSLVTVENPTGSLVASRYTIDGTGAEINVVTNLIINGNEALVAIQGNSSGSGIEGVSTLGYLIDSGATVDVDGSPVPVGDLPVYVVDVADFPADPAADDYSYSSSGSNTIPLFTGLEPLGGSSTATAIPTFTSPLPTSFSQPVDLTGGLVSSEVLLLQTPIMVDVSAPMTSLNALPVEWIPVYNVVEEMLVPAMAAAEPIQAAIQDGMNALMTTIQDNWDQLQGLMDMMDGGNIDIFSVISSIPAIVDIAQTADDLIKDFRALIPVIGQQLTIVETDLLPAILAALPADGIPFGGYSDGNPSTVADDVLPFIQAQIDVLQEILPGIDALLADMDALIPDSGSGITWLFQLMGNVMGDGIDDIMADMEALMPHIGNSLAIFDDMGIPILYDLLEEAEQIYVPGGSPISDTEEYQDMITTLSAALPPDTTLGDLPGFDFIEPYLADFIPPEWGIPADVSLFDTVLPEIGDADIGADILPALRDGLGELDAALPGIIDEIYNFSISDFGFDFGGFF